jgi:hypothetical protein
MNDDDLRDLFAGMALQGLASRGVMEGSEPRVATWCYVLADAMIEAKYYEEPEEPQAGITAIKRKRKAAKE